MKLKKQLVLFHALHTLTAQKGPTGVLGVILYVHFECPKMSMLEMKGILFLHAHMSWLNTDAKKNM